MSTCFKIVLCSLLSGVNNGMGHSKEHSNLKHNFVMCIFLAFRIVSLFRKYLDQYKPFELFRVTNVLAMLHWPKSDIYSKLQQLSIW